MCIRDRAGLLLVTLVGIPMLVWVLVMIAAARHGVTHLHEAYAEKREDRRRHAESRAAVVTAAAVLADVPDPVTEGLPLAAPSSTGRWGGTSPLDDESPEVIAAVVAGAHPRRR